jgi:hypothetical protein
VGDKAIIFTLSLIVALLSLLQDKSDFRSSFAGREALYEDEDTLLHSLRVNLASRFL